MTMKVALVADWFAPRRGGIESQLLGLANGLKSAGVDVNVITSMPGPDLVGGIAVTRLKCLRLPWLLLAVSPRLVGILKAALLNVRPDVVHIHPSIVAPTCLAGFIAARSLGLPVVLTFHSWMVNLPRLLRLADRIWGWASPPVRVTGVGRHIVAQLDTVRPGLNAGILPNGFDYEFWSKQDGPLAARQGFTIATAIRFETKKRPLVLPELLKTVAQSAKGKQVDLVAAGQGRLSRAVLKKAARLGVAQQFHIEGWLDREGLRSLYKRADVFVLPSITESFGLAALEARAAGLPVVARSGTGVDNYITDGIDGILCSSDIEMAEALVRLCHDRDLLARLSGPRPALIRHDWSRVTARHLEVYRDLVRQAGAAPDT
ncbi:MAG: glycosyltransferase family 4 protein [Hoeflea sp.]|nr:glycosyltransferase family 4 protein [Alphaproteobacteria bacterium]MBV1722870.1 glycosyltransferase family 4 protein [Hoeflea sp.]MBU4542753.1 glycosyltransferase family 4 protein [Alphaproteobacteria bacterium]MBU4552565.1 glycosyltransferase family 4 protein [Alphaproteobacteria bacterium]MBV1762781.1 glycosyltransferase family 4 protein [Hoeflea sp.]